MVFQLEGWLHLTLEEGVISPGGVGYDISCGVRVLRTNIDAADISSRLEDIMYKLYAAIPKGVGSKGRIKLSKQQMDKVIYQGCRLGGKAGIWMAGGY